MRMKKLSPGALSEWVGALAGRQRVYAPQARGDRFVYDLLRSPADLRLDHDVTVLPPKKYLMPPSEVILTYTRAGEFRAVSDAQPMVLLGVHPYDVAAIAQMDRYFTVDKPDARYLARRKNVTIIAADVQNPSAHVFAAAMGTATVRDGYDILLTQVGEGYVAESRTPAGDALLALAQRAEEADAVSLARREQAWQSAQRMLGRNRMRCRPEDLPQLLDRSYEHRAWAEKSALCFSCGSCVMVCPSCFCFDVQEDIDWKLEGGARRRCWDGCLLSEFALVAGGHNFRKDREERYRHRFYRKGKYLPGRCGFVACVGCGRCATACTSGIADPADLYTTLMEES